MNLLQFVYKLQFNYDTQSAKYKQFAGLAKLIRFNNPNKPISTIDYDFINSFKLALNSTKLSQNTKFNYWNRFKELLNEAYKYKLTVDNLSTLVTSMDMEESDKIYLTKKDVSLLFEHTPSLEKKLANRLDVLKDMARISLYTGMRFSDIQKLDFDTDFIEFEDNLYIKFRQDKTNRLNTIKVNKNLLELVNKYTKQPFVNEDYHNMQWVLKKWVKVVNSDITFHSFRHTFAMNLAINNVDILTISKLLGHTNVVTTQKYVKSLQVNEDKAIDILNF